MSYELAALLVLLGFLAAVLSGLLGIGGALMLVPLLLHVPEALGLATYGVRDAAAIAVAQAAVAAASGTFANVGRGLVYRRLAFVVVGALVLGAFGGGWLSQFVPPFALLALLATLATVGAGVMFVPSTRPEDGPAQPSFNSILAFSCSLAVGTVIGLVGGGSFTLIPIQVHVLRIPTRTAMATGLAAVFPTTASALLGKGLGGQVPVLAAVLVCLLSIPGAQLGTALSARLSARALRFVYAIVVMNVAAGLWYDVLQAR